MKLRALALLLALAPAANAAQAPYYVVMAPRYIMAGPPLGTRPVLPFSVAPILATNLSAGGGGTPGGSSGQIQYNNAGVFGGTTAFTMSGANVTAIDLGGTTDTTLTRSGAGLLAIEGVDILTTGSTATVTGKTFRGPNGTRAAPTYSFASDNTRGWTNSPDVGNAIEAVVGGAQMMTVSNSGVFAYVDWPEAHTSNYTTTLVDSAKILTNTGASGAVTYTLLNNQTAGAFYHFQVTAAQTVNIAPSAGETMYFGSSTCANLACASIGCSITIKAPTGGSGGLWFTAAHEGTWTCS